MTEHHSVERITKCFAEVALTTFQWTSNGLVGQNVINQFQYDGTAENSREYIVIEQLLSPLVLALNQPFRSLRRTLTVTVVETAFTQVS